VTCFVLGPSLRIGRLLFDIDDLFYFDPQSLECYQYLEASSDGAAWYRPVRRLWIPGFWWVCSPDCRERRQFGELKPILTRSRKPF